MASAHQSKRHVLNVVADASYCSSTIPTVLVYVLRSSSFSHRCLDHGKHLTELVIVILRPVSPAIYGQRRIARSGLSDAIEGEFNAALGDGQLLSRGSKPVGARCDDAHGGVDVGQVAGQAAADAGEGFEMSHGHSSICCSRLSFRKLSQKQSASRFVDGRSSQPMPSALSAIARHFACPSPFVPLCRFRAPNPSPMLAISIKAARMS